MVNLLRFLQKEILVNENFLDISMKQDKESKKNI